MSDEQEEPSATAVSRRLAPGGGGGGAWIGGPKTASSEKFGNTDKKSFHLLGTDLFGEEIKADVSGKLREKFDFPPFTILNAREGPWQERKRAWLSLGIDSEVGRGENLLKMSDTLLVPDPEKRAAMQAARGLTWGTADMDEMRRREGTKGADAKTYGSGGPGELSAGFKAKSFNTQEWVAKKVEEGEIDGGMAGNQTGTSIFDPVLTELCYRWFCSPGGLILDPFAGGSVRGLVAGLLGFRYHGIELRPEQIAANEAQRLAIAPDADINWVVGDSNKMLLEAPMADMAFSCPPYGSLELYSDDPDDISNMSWENFVGVYRAIIRKTVERMKPNTFAIFVVGEYRDKETGLYRGFVPLTCAAFMAAGAALYNEAILITAVGSLPIRVTKQFETSRKLGKALRNGTLVLTPKGWSPIEALSVGDEVIAGDGQPTNVTGVFPQGVKSLWTVTFNDGVSIDADPDHLWAVESRDTSGMTNNYVLTTAEIVLKYGTVPSDPRPRIPACAPVQFPLQEVPLAPYLLGLLLGDGGLSTNTPVLTSNDPEVVVRAESMLPDGVSARQLPQRGPNGSYSYILAGVAARSVKNQLTVILRSLGLMDKSSPTRRDTQKYKADRKFVPKKYLWNSPEVRLDVLRGLMDSDGSVTNGRQGSTEYSSTSPQLIADVIFLARSLGARVKVHSREAREELIIGHLCHSKKSYRVRIVGGPCPFWLPRKANIWEAANKKRRSHTHLRRIRKIEKAEDGPATCISVAHASGLFVVENFVVTHNTHQNVLCFVKGDPKLAADAIRQAPVVEGALRSRRQAPRPAAEPAEGQATAAAAPLSAEATPEDASSAGAMAFALTPREQSQQPVAVTAGGSLADLLGTTQPRLEVNFTPDEPPDLHGINEIVLNFATDGLDWAGGSKPVGVTVSTMDGKLCRFLPFAFRGGNLSEEAVKRWAREQLRGKKITNANTRFDMHMGRVWGVDLEEQGCTFSDVQHTAALLDDHRKQFKLDKLAADFLPNFAAVDRVDESQHANYHAGDVAAREKHTAELVWRLRDVMYPELEKQELMDVQRLEDDVIPAVVEMETNGSPLDMELLEQYHTECVRRHDQLLREIAEEAGFLFDHTNKSWQRLFEKFGLPVTDSIAGEVIEAIDHPIVKKGYLAAQYASLDSKTFKAYREHVGSDGVLRFDINQLRGDEGGTVSGRFSIGYVQQVPNHDNHFATFGEDLFPRRLFIPAPYVMDDGSDAEYLEADAMQIEQRLLVHYADNKRVIKEYEGDYDRLMRWQVTNAKEDEPISYHKVTWAMMKEYKADMMYSHQKNFNFARQYGAKTVKLGVMMKFITAAEGEEIRRAKRWDDPRLKTVKEIESAYKRMMPEGDELLDRASHLAKSSCDEFCKRGDKLHQLFPHRGYVKTLVGRRSRFPHNYKTYIGLNRVLQGTGADIMKKKATELHRERKHTGLVLRLTVHDAVGGDARMRETKQRVSEVLNAQSFSLKVPILWSVHTGANWAACK